MIPWTGNKLPNLLLFLLGLLVYANSFPGDFFIDDVHLVAENPLVESMDIRTIFTTDYWGPQANKSGVFRPLTILSFALNKRLLGPEPWSYHLVNVILHGLAGLLLFQLLLRWHVPSMQSFLAAALFALHPIHTEAVNEVVGRSELMVALFILLALNLSASARTWQLMAAGLFYLLALLSKEHAITFLAAILLSDIFFHRGIRTRVPFYLALLVLTGAWLLYRQFGLEYGTVNPFRNSSQLNAIYQPLAQLSTPVRLLTALKIQLFYLGKLVFPFNLQAVYSGPAISSPVNSIFSVWGALFTLAGASLTGLAVYGWRQRRPFALAIALYAVSFSVTANIFFVSGIVMAERAAYLPSAWFCMALATLLPDTTRLKVVNRAVMITLLTVLLLVAAALTWTRNSDFSNQVRLWSKDFERDPRNTIAGTYLIDAYIQTGEYSKAAKVGAIILDHHPGLPESLEMQAWLLVRAGNPEQALVYAEKALRQMGDAPTQGLLTTLVEINVLLNRPAEVLKWLDRHDQAARVGFYWELKGNAYAALGMYRQAVDSYRRVGEPPIGSEVPLRLEQLLRQLGEYEEAEKVRKWIKLREIEFGDKLKQTN